jgi:hypothetical protein
MEMLCGVREDRKRRCYGSVEDYRETAQDFAASLQLHTIPGDNTVACACPSERKAAKEAVERLACNRGVEEKPSTPSLRRHAVRK